MPQKSLSARLPTAAIAFRGYNVTNLGRTPELLAHSIYGPRVEAELKSISTVASDLLNRSVDLVGQVRTNQEPTLQQYGEALALLLAVESIQLGLLSELFDVPWAKAKFSFGFSLGEISAVIAGGVFDIASALQVLLPLADDCVELSRDATLGVLFTRSRELALDDIRRLCLEVNQEGRGVVGISAQLAPNTLLLIGQHDSLDRLMARAANALDIHIHLRKNDFHWPPVHTPIVWQKQISNRAAQRMHTVALNHAEPRPRVFSLVTGTYGYTSVNTRELLCQWIDHPQRLWDGIYETLASGVTTVLHVGPDPNIIPATFERLSANVVSQTQESRSLRALSAAIRRLWLRRLLPQRAALLRAPYIDHIILEDWLLANAPK